MSKNNGFTNGHRNFIQYDIGDNDFYWLNCEDCSYFFVVPEQIFIDKGLIGNNGVNNGIMFKIKIKQ